MDAAWAGVIGVVVGAFVTQGFNIWQDARRTEAQRVERERDRTHERDLRQLELDDAHRARLYSDRKVAYADFYRSYDDYRRSADEFATAGARVTALLRSGTANTETVDGIVTEPWHKLIAARRAIDQRLLLIELAASPAVRDAAVEVRERAWDREFEGMGDHSGFEEDLARLGAADRAVDEAERRLREAIQVELELGR
jgi:hypothetical protein